MTQDLLKEIEAACEKATPGPWDFERISWEDGSFSYEVNNGDFLISISELNYDKEPIRAKFDSDFIGGARTWIPQLLSHIKSQDARIRELEGALRKASAQFAAIKHQTQCIGLTLTHVDFNCLNCLATFSEQTADKALSPGSTKQEKEK